jgi:TolB-like protein/DNA-binding winged helix-turn-helix (wHTH) protein/Flp pilus assembly protein TadD
MSPGPPATYRFREFELDVAAYELRRRGRAVRLERRPMDLLILLVERRRQLVSRAEIVGRLWGDGVFVDVEMGINTAIRKVRQALGDSSDSPAFVETVQGRGYRFIADVDPVPDGGADVSPQEDPRPVPAPPAAPSTQPPEARPPGETTPRPRGRVWVAAVIGAMLLATIGAALWRRTLAPPATVILAVLPFENLSGDPQHDYMADGLTEETIAALGQIEPHLNVIGRTSTLAYRRSGKSLAQMGTELGVDYVVESSLRAEGARLRITSKLIRLRDQVQVWSASYDSEPTSVLALQRELSTAIVEQIRQRLSPERLSALARRQTRDPQAYDLYLRGRYVWNQLKPPATREAIKYFERATEIDRDYALAWSGLADAYVASPINGDAAPLEVLPRARAAAEHAVRADARLAEAQNSMAMVHFWQGWDIPSAEVAFRRAIALDPAYELAQRTLGVMLAHAGRYDEAKPLLRRARELEPLNPMSHALSSHVAYLAGDHPEAVAFARQAIVVDPELWIGHFLLGEAAERLDQDELALEELSASARLSGGNSKALALRGFVLAGLGRTREAREVLDTLAAVRQARYMPPYATALIHAGLGETAAALEWLDRAYDVRDVHLVYLPVDPKWDGLRADPRFRALLERCGLVGPAVRVR